MTHGRRAALARGTKLVLASGNVGKLGEFADMFTPLGIDVIPQSAFGVCEAEEPYDTFVENALAKARHAARATGLPALADDSGICVDVLHGAPGVLSARYAGEPRSDARNNAKLLDDLASHADRSAYYYCVLVLMRHALDPQPLIVEGTWFGEVIDTPCGAGGFGYDPYFWLPSHQLTAAEMPAEEKNRVSHRAQALRSLLQALD
ncbi:MAG: RdgB/HAM1 family non-canonical purine NTP pyrophosphatase [Pseudomonadota bacterium]